MTQRFKMEGAMREAEPVDQSLADTKVMLREDLLPTKPKQQLHEALAAIDQLDEVSRTRGDQIIDDLPDDVAAGIVEEVEKNAPVERYGYDAHDLNVLHEVQPITCRPANGEIATTDFDLYRQEFIQTVRKEDDANPFSVVDELDHLDR